MNIAAKPLPDGGPAGLKGLVAWILLGLATLACVMTSGVAPWLVQLPDDATLPINAGLNELMDGFIALSKWFFRALSWLFEQPMFAVQVALQWLPWPTVLIWFTFLGYASGGWRVALFVAASLAYVLLLGFWEPSMNSLALVAISVPLAVGAGFALGSWAFVSRRAARAIEPLLDMMQTIPTFAYLVPILLLFGFGPVVGMIAGAIYACPPMVKNVLLGLRRVPEPILEAGLMSGATRPQLFWRVRVPAARPQIMLGVNQAILAAFSMIIIASVIGSFRDIGWEVLSSLRKARFGDSLVAGLVIALMAMMMDRISAGFAMHRPDTVARHRASYARRPWVWAMILGALMILAARFVPALQTFPDAWQIEAAKPLNEGVRFLVSTFPNTLLAIKNAALNFILLPLKIGWSNTVKPYSWGFDLTPAAHAAYVLLSVLIIGAGARLLGRTAAVAISILAILYYVGTTNLPWPVFIAAVTLLGYQTGGRPVAVFACLGFLFMLLSGVWYAAMLSVYLCATAVLVCLVMGGSLGIWASESDLVSKVLRPVNDTLQTMPMFVFLIPVIMFFKIGEFPAVLAIIAYAIVPTIRYTEHGLRQVRPDIVEASRMMGATRLQILTRVKLPLALPEIMLGLNQTIMFALAMLAVTALVGTRDLGQQIYIALTAADFGAGFIAGISMALIAMIADRSIQSWAAQERKKLGLA